MCMLLSSLLSATIFKVDHFHRLSPWNELVCFILLFMIMQLNFICVGTNNIKSCYYFQLMIVPKKTPCNYSK